LFTPHGYSVALDRRQVKKSVGDRAKRFAF
jgi:hypothetical protein